MTETDWLTIGKLVSPQGLKGEVRVNPSSDFPERFLKPGNRWLQKGSEKPRKMQLISGRRLPGKSLFIVSFAEIKNRADAESIVGQKMLVPSTERPALADNEFHFLDLIGLKVKLKDSKDYIGEIVNLTTAGNDLLEIELAQGKKVLVPFVKEIVPEVNIKEGFIVLTPPKGLLTI